MKEVYLRISRLLAAYFIALPLLFGFYASLHSHSVHSDHEKEAQHSDINSDCQVCDVVLSSLSTFESIEIAAVDFEISENPISLKEGREKSYILTLYLRGPPMA